MGQRADAGANFQHAAMLVRAADLGGVAGHPALNEEILPHGLGKAETVARQQFFNCTAVAKIHNVTPLSLYLFIV